MQTTGTDIKTIEISGEALSSCLKGFPDFLLDIAKSILYTHNINDPKPGNWYNFNSYLNVLKEIGATYGEDTIYAIGKQGLHCAIFPKHIGDFEEALNKLEEVFALNHRNGDICFVTDVKMNLSKKRVELCLENPYPYALNRGLLTAIAREYSPFKSLIPEVKLEEAQTYKTKGVYIITW